MKYVLSNCNLFDGVSGEENLRENIDIYVNEGTIAAVVDHGAAEPGYELVDCTGLYAVPGLINLHVHLFGTGKPSKTLSGGGSAQALIKLTKTALGAKILDSMVQAGARTQLASGVTTVRAVGDFHWSDVRLRDRINKGVVAGPRLLVSGPAITVPGGHGDGTFAVTATEPEDLRALVRTHKEHGVDFIKICVTGGVMDAKVKGEPGELKMSLEQTAAVCDEAHKLGFYVASHTESTGGVLVALGGGVDTVEHGAPATHEAIELYRRTQAADVCTVSPAIPLSKLDPGVTLMNEFTQFNANIVFEGIVQGARDALDAGVPVGLGTDSSCPFVTQYDMWREVYYFAKHVGVSPAFALHTATLINARIAGIAEATGSVEKGKCADIALYDANPLEDLTALRTPRMVVARGRRTERPAVKRIGAVDAELDKLL